MKTYRIRFQTVAAVSAASCLLSAVAIGHAAENESKSRPPSNVSISISTDEGTTRTAELAGAAATFRAARQGLLRPVGDGPVKTVDDFRGRAIMGADQKRLGQAEDFIVDTATGNVVYTVVAHDSEGSLRLVQQSSLELTRDGFVTELDQAAFEAAESVTREQLDADEFTRIPDKSRAVSDSIAHRSTSSTPATTPAIGLLPPAAESTSAATTAAAAHPEPVTPATTQPFEVTAGPSGGVTSALTQVTTHLVRASSLRGANVRAQDERLGTVEAIALDMDQGTATAVLALTPMEVGRPTKFHVPLSTLQFGGVSDVGIATSLSRSDFEQALSLGQLAKASEQAVQPDDERLSPTGRTGSGFDTGTSAGAAGNSKADTAKSTWKKGGDTGENRSSSSAGNSKSSGGFNRDRAQSGDGLEGTLPEPQDRVLETTDDVIAGGADSASAVTKVRETLSLDGSLGADEVEVKVAGKKIELLGTVRTEEQKTRVEAAARKAAGPTPIENKLTVQRK